MLLHILDSRRISKQFFSMQFRPQQKGKSDRNFVGTKGWSLLVSYMGKKPTLRILDPPMEGFEPV